MTSRYALRDEQWERIKDLAMGRSKGGLNTQIHAVVDALGNPIQSHLTPGQACDLNGMTKTYPKRAT